jgi:hypothetical protein
MAGYIGAKQGVTQVDGYNRSEADAEFVQVSGDTMSANGTTVLTVDRATSDGAIIDLQKDGSTVGSIASDSGSMLLGSGDVGVYFDASSDRIIPMNMSTLGVRNDAIDLGGNPHRFKDLYLSGGVYLGGTGSANYLDDYEEGTWTPVDGNGNAYNSGVNSTYTKIGRIVYVNFDVSSTGSTGTSKIAGLPFTASPASVSGNWSIYGGYSTDNSDLWGHINQGTSEISMFVGSSSHILNGRWIGAGFYYTEA